MQLAPIKSLSTSEVLDFLRRGAGSAFLIPTGYNHILVPAEEYANILRLLESHVTTHVPVDSLRQTPLPSTVRCTKRKRKRNRSERPDPVKKPPRPPNAFILYRKDKQKSVQEREVGITNNEVSKVIGDMWKQEAQDVKDHYQALAQQSREQHQRDYPDYKYAPRRPGERKRRGVHHEIVFGDSEIASNTEESLSYDIKSPADYRFTSSGSYYQDMLGMSNVVDSPDELDLSRFHPPHHTPCMTSTSDTEHGWYPTPPVDQTPELPFLDAGHPNSGHEGDAYWVCQTTLTLNEREPSWSQDLPVRANFRYIDYASSSSLTSPMEWAAGKSLVAEISTQGVQNGYIRP